MRVEGIVDEVQPVGRAPPSRAELVEAQPAGDDHQPTLGIIEAGDVRAGQSGECFLHHVLGVGDVEQHAKGKIEHPSPVRLPERSEHRIVGMGTHGFLRMPSRQINFRIEGWALVVATAMVERT